MHLDFHERFTNIINKMEEAGDLYAEARGQSYQLQELKGTVLARIMQKIQAESSAKIPQGALEVSAKATPEYEAYINGVYQAIEKEHKTKNQLEKYKAAFEATRSLSSLEKATIQNT